MDIAINQAEYSNTPAGPVVHIFGREADGTAHEVKGTGFRPSLSLFFYFGETLSKEKQKAYRIKTIRFIIGCF